MKVCPNCQNQYPDDANFCPQEGCATPDGPRRLEPIGSTQAAAAAPPQRYELEDQLGGSRSGGVWRARDSQSGATVAYKVVAQASLPTVASAERAQRELKQLQRSQSNRLARVLDFGKEADGRLFVASELVAGQTLDQLLAGSGPLPLDRAKAIVAQIGEALLEGQKVGVVHHDLSPKNVMVGANDDVKVINFVAAVPVSDTVFGVAEFLSPEQAEGKLVDQRSNTYSLGGILMMMLTGQTPVSGADTGAVLEQVTKGELVPPSRRGNGASTLTPEIDRVILKAMDKSPNRRPLTMRQFLTEVSGLVALGAAPAAGAGGQAGVGFAKTMLFTGGSPEVQKLVQQAVAARGGATGATAAAPAAAPAATPPPEPGPAQAAAAAAAGQATPAPVGPRRTHGAAIAATVVSLPAAKVPGMPGASTNPNQSGQVTPPPVASTPPLQPLTPPPQAISATPAPGVAPTPKPAAGGNFRETLWFKKGDVDQMVAEARARVEAARARGVAVSEADAAAAAGAPAAPEEQAKPLSDQYVDDGTLTAEDRKKFSLRSGATSTALPTVGGAVPGERMSDAEVMGEIGGKKRIGIIIVAVIVAALLGIFFFKKMTAKDVSKNAAAMTPPTIPTTTPTPPPEATPPPAPPPPPVAAVKPPAPAATKDKEADDPAPPKASHSAAKKHAAKKAKGKKAHR
ncbi:MAG TPA: serine/threonine-protein kinase [Polyangia bacterium]|jgi:serine/threonine-protein kinase